MPDKDKNKDRDTESNSFSRLEARIASSGWGDPRDEPLETLQDCYNMIDVGWPGKSPSFAEVQRAYRHELWKNNVTSPGLSQEAIVYRAIKLECVQRAYLCVCKHLEKDPESGLEETEETLMAERDELLRGLEGHSCGTPAMYVAQEYRERIDALKNRKKAN